MTFRYYLLFQILCVAIYGLCFSVSNSSGAAEPLINAHSHNDYWHERPLTDALDLGFTSVEADVFLSDGRLLVGHDRAELKPDRTLEALYLEPLAKRVRANNGNIFANADRFWLFVDIKSDAEATYRQLQQVLPKYADMLTSMKHGKVHHGAVTIVLSGNRPFEAVSSANDRLVALDGRVTDLKSDESDDLLPVISDNWGTQFRWRGDGPMPESERARLLEIVHEAHRARRSVRFWATPEKESVWQELRLAGVDLIGTDDLGRLAAFLQSSNKSCDRRVIHIDLPSVAPIQLRLIAKLGPGPNKENSGIVRSRQNPDLFWMHNDSGDEPRIYPVDRRGKNHPNAHYPDEHGILVGGAINVDWEDITADAAGHIIVADTGNNGNDRRDLVLYYLEEPAATAGRTTYVKKIFLRYPDQHEFPARPNDFNFDCEAVFTVENTVFLLSKNRSNNYTSLYRLDNPFPDVINEVKLLETFDLHGQAVGADCTPDGMRLAVLTYSAVWVFSRTALDQDFFTQAIHWAPFGKRDAEAICFADNNTLLIADEALGELYELPIADLTKVK